MSQPLHPILGHPIWRELRPYARVSIGSQNNSRITLVGAIPPALKKRALEVRVPCARCGDLMYPVRMSYGSTSADVFATGQSDNGHKRCRYGNPAKWAAAAITDDILNGRDFLELPSTQQPLLDDSNDDGVIH